MSERLSDRMQITRVPNLTAEVRALEERLAAAEAREAALREAAAKYVRHMTKADEADSAEEWSAEVADCEDECLPRRALEALLADTASASRGWLPPDVAAEAREAALREVIERCYGPVMKFWDFPANAFGNEKLPYARVFELDAVLSDPAASRGWLPPDVARRVVEALWIARAGLDYARELCSNQIAKQQITRDIERTDAALAEARRYVEGE